MSFTKTIEGVAVIQLLNKRTLGSVKLLNHIGQNKKIMHKWQKKNLQMSAKTVRHIILVVIKTSFKRQ